MKVACNHSLPLYLSLYMPFMVEGHDSFNYWFWTCFVLRQHVSKRSPYQKLCRYITLCRFWRVWWVGCFVSELCGREILSELLNFFCWVHGTSSEKGWMSKEEWWEKLSISLILLVERHKRCWNFKGCLLEWTGFFCIGFFTVLDMFEGAKKLLVSNCQRLAVN